MRSAPETTIAGQSSESSLLDRPINLAATPPEAIAWATLLVTALVIRLIGRTNWPLAPEEAAIARDAYALVQGNDLTASATAQPSTVLFTSLSFFLFGDTDYTARMVPLVAGIVLIGVLFWMRRWIGHLPAFSVGVVWTVSPVMMMSTMRLDGAMLLVLASLAIVALVFAMSVNPGSGKAAALGISLAIGLTAHPLGWIFVPLGFLLTVAMVRDPEFISRLPRILVVFLISLIVITTFVFTRPLALFDFFSESWRVLWNMHISATGEGWHLPVLTLLVDEPLAVAMALTGLALVLNRSDWSTSSSPTLTIAFTAWAVPAVALGIILGGKSPALYAVSLFPFIMLGGIGLSIVIDATLASGFQWKRIALTVMIGFVAIVALFRFLDSMAQGPGDDAPGWIVSALILGLLIVLPLAVLTIRQVRSLGAAVIPMTLLAIAILLGMAGLRSSLLLPATTTDRPGEVLISGSSAPSVSEIVDRLHTYGRDASIDTREVRDPTGVHGLVIIVDERVREPFGWYFREFPDLIVAHEESLADLEVTPDAILTDPVRAEAYDEAIDGFDQRTYGLTLDMPASLAEPALSDAVAAVLNPLGFRDALNFAIYRQTEAPREIDVFTLMLRNDHAAAFWGPATDE